MEEREKNLCASVVNYLLEEEFEVSFSSFLSPRSLVALSSLTDRLVSKSIRHIRVGTESSITAG
jgi:hypothetical protein